MRRLTFGVVFAAMLPCLIAPAFVAAQEAPAVCRAGQDDRTERPAPLSLLPRLGRAFGVDPQVLRGTSYVRCAGGRWLGCMTGANLNCGHANVNRRSDGGDAFCRDTPGADSVPLAAVGHDTLWEWHCVGTHAVAGEPVGKVDRLGFARGNWRPLR